MVEPKPKLAGQTDLFMAHDPDLRVYSIEELAASQETHHNTQFYKVKRQSKDLMDAMNTDLRGLRAHQTNFEVLQDVVGAVKKEMKTLPCTVKSLSGPQTNCSPASECSEFQ